VNRLGYDNVQVIDPADGYATVRQFSVGNGTNPQDIAFASPTKAYVSRLGSPELLVVDPATGTALGSISLAPWADADGNPEAARLAMVGDLLLVALGRLTNFVPADTGLVVVVDTRADTILDADPLTPGLQVVRLAGTNPGTDFVLLPASGPGEERHLYLGCVGTWGVLDGGIEELIVPGPLERASEPIRSAGFVVTEAALGGDVLDIATDGGGHPYAIVSDAAFNTSLVSWDPQSGTRLGTLYAPGGYSLSDAALDGRGGLWVCNSSYGAPGLYVFEAGSDTALAGPIATGMPPIQVLFVEDSTAAPPDPRPAAPVSIVPPAPNPAHGPVQIGFVLADPGPASVEILDLAGRRLRVLAAGPFSAGTTVLPWDLAGDDGRRVPPGIYFVRATSAGATAARRLVVL